MELWNRPLAIVTAPSGFGKTTLVRNFAYRDSTKAVIWVSLGQELVDEMWVWQKICDKCGEFCSPLAEKLRSLGLPQTAQEIDYVIGMAVSYISRPVCLVIDDFQECNSTNINKLITKITYEEPPNLHILLISRMYPELPYEEMLLRGYCINIDQTSLALTKEETREVFSINGVPLTDSQLENVYEYTDGWISAVYLSLFEFQRRGNLGRYTSVSHLLKTAIFDKISDSIKGMLVKMSPFDSFILEEAVYITDTATHPMCLIDFMDQYGFMQFDLLSQSYSMHSLLRSVAAAELERSGIDVKLLFNRGGEWNEKNKNYVKALVYYRNAGNEDSVFRLLSGEERNLIFEAVPAVVEDIFENTTAEIKAKYPIAWLGYIYGVILRHRSNKGKTLFEEASAVYNKLYQLEEEKKELKGELLILQSLLEFNDLEKIIVSLHSSYELLGRKASDMFRQSLLTYGAPFMTMLYYKKSGELKRTIELEKEYALYHMRLVGGGDCRWDDMLDAEYALLTGDMQKAYDLSVQVAKKAVLLRQVCIIISSYFLQFRALVYFGRQCEFEQKMQEFAYHLKDIARPILILDAELAYSYIYACLGRKEKMADWCRNFDLAECGNVVKSARSGCLTYAMLLCKTGEWALLDTIADQSMVPYEGRIHLYSVIRGWVYKAVAAYNLKNPDLAKEYFYRAVDLAEPDQVKIPFIENGIELLPIIETLEHKSEFCRSLKPQILQYQKSLKLFGKETEKVNLTRREEELMKLVREGLRNQEISQQMNIALVTVEKNLTSIYRKLQVTNRAAAIAKIDEMM